MTAGIFEQAVAHQRAGRLTEAARLYREVLAGDPNHGDALFLLGGFDIQAGRLQAAVDKLQRATVLNPGNAAYFSNLGEAYRRLGRYPEAVNALLKAMSLRPDLAEVTFNLGVVLEELGETDGAVACFERARQLKPELPVISRRLAEARKGGRKIEPGQTLRSGSAGILTGIAAHLHAQGDTERAVALCRRALELKPRYAAALNLLGVMLADLGRIDEAIASFRRALALEPDAPEFLGNLGYALGTAGLVDEAIATIRQSIGLSRDPATHGNLVFVMPFSPSCDSRAILVEAREWDGLYGKSVAGPILSHDNDRAPERRLRIGYVSADFRRHCQTLFTLPLLSHHDHEQFEIFCYSSVHTPDEHTERLIRHADHWRTVAGLDDATAADRVRSDRVDVLVDLTMHMAQNRMHLFARKPAPVQVCWLAYPGTTGLSAMDYRISDPYLDPPDGDRTVYSEETVLLPDTFWCYDPLASGPAVGPLPARKNGCITLGCLNSFVKVNPEVLALWARVLRAVKNSRLVLMVPLGEARGRVARAFAEQGIARDRVEFVGRRDRDAYLASYNEIDVCLDTFPYNGHTTSLDALWMGVPVVTLVGTTVVGRAGLCQAMNLGLPQLVARSHDDYLRIVVELCEDLDRLEDLRATLRGRIEASPLMDAPRFARNLEAAYRNMWRRWTREVR